MATGRGYIVPITAGLAGSLALAGIYFGVVSWAESSRHAVELFWEDRFIVLPILLGFGVQVGLFVVLKKGLFAPAADAGASGALTGAGGGTSAMAMVACCAHHAADVLPFLGLTAAVAFLAEYRFAFMLVGLGTTFVGIAVMLTILLKERRRAALSLHAVSEPG